MGLAEVPEGVTVTVELYYNSINRLLEIAEDGQVQPDELEDFTQIKASLDKIALSVSNLQLWVDEQIAAGSPL